LDGGKTAWELQVSLVGMKAEDALRVLLPPEYAALRVRELAETIFPEDEQGRSLVEARFDLLENPDLPEIYSVLLDAFSQWRLGHCSLKLTGKLSGNPGTQIEFSDPVAQHLQHPAGRSRKGKTFPALTITIEQEYRALDYSVERGSWESREKLLEWLQSLTLLYYLDKHEYPLPTSPKVEADRRLITIAAVLSAQGIIAASAGQGVFYVTESGRAAIGRLLAETESYIARFDVFKDVAYDRDAGLVEFDTGRGEDLRVSVFVAEGLDPLRVVFLLRLYDGTFSEYLPTWQQLIHTSEFFEEILEPVVNHCQVDESLMGWIIESGYAYLEEREDVVREQRSHTDILERLRAI
jgi:hypothetical protein